METKKTVGKENKGAKKAEPRKALFPIEASLNIGGGLSDLLKDPIESNTKNEEAQLKESGTATEVKKEVTKNIAPEHYKVGAIPAEEGKAPEPADKKEESPKASASESTSYTDPEFESFLAPSEVGKKGTSIYVSAETHKSIEKIVKYLGNGTTIGDYAEQIFAEHFRRYGKEIRKRIEAARKKEDKESLRF